MISLDYSLGQCLITVEQLPGPSVELNLSLCVVNLEQSPRTSAVCAAWHTIRSHGLASIALYNVPTADQDEVGHNRML